MSDPVRPPAGLRVALVHDWLTGMRGGEKVLEAIAELFPDAEIYTLLHVPGSVSPAIERHPIHRSFVQRLPASATKYRNYLPLFPAAIERFRFDGYDLVISSSHCVAKSAIVPEDVPHLCYCHSPMRYAWDQFDAYFGPDQVGALASRALRPVLGRMARWDAATASRVDRFVANSQYVAGRIARYYNRESTVVYPPVDTAFYHPDPSKRRSGYALVVSALVPYKRLDVAVRAAAEAGIPLKIVGRGPEASRLRAAAPASTEFLGWLSNEEIRDLYQRCDVVLMPGVEDFGMVPVEAMACGRPAIAFAEGGATESVVAGTTGLLVDDPSPEAFAAAIRTARDTDWDPAAIRAHAERFSLPRFLDDFSVVINETLTGAASVSPRRRNSADREDEQ